MRLITVAGCLAMVYMTCISSPVTTDFFRALGATDLHFGLLSGIPMVTLSLQFVGAFLTNRCRRRRPLFMLCAIAARTLYLAIGLAAFFCPEESRKQTVALLIALTGLSAALGNLSVPLWFSWMGDLIPRRILNRYWGRRQMYMTSVWAISFCAVAALTYSAKSMAVPRLFAVLAAIGWVAGVVDILLFAFVREPENVVVSGRGAWDVLCEPFRHEEYRAFVAFGCAFSASAMLGAAFMQVYVLKVLKLAVWKATLAWCAYGVGSALTSSMWGHAADRHGHRPVLLLCVALKPFICLVFLAVTADTAFVALAVCFLFDSVLNAGYVIAMNGYMLKTAPQENRSMFIAAVTALSGVCGGLGAICGGVIMRHTQALSFCMLGREWTNYHLIFLLSFGCRALCVCLAAMVREPASSHPVVVLTHLSGQWPLRMLLFPVGLYRRRRRRDAD